MKVRSRWAAVLALAVLSLPGPGGALADDDLDERVAIYRALVRNEPLALPRPSRQSAEVACRPVPTGFGLKLEVRRAVRDASLRFALPRGLIHSVILHESDYDPAAASLAGAVGLMQLMPATARELGVVCRMDPRQNILGGSRYLRELHDRFGSWRLALAAYNAGPSRVEVGRIPPVTRLYVRRVLASWKRYDGA